MSTQQAYNTGKCKWEYGQPYDYTNGKASRKLHGPCPTCGNPTGEYGFAIVCLSDYCARSANRAWVSGVPIPGPSWWTDGTRVFLDGEAWCAVLPGFINLQESLAGFGASPQEAVDDLLLAYLNKDATP